MATDEKEQSTFELPAAQPEHRWLSQWIGEWRTEGSEEGERSWTERVRPIGDIWIQCEGTGAMPGTDVPATTILTVGFDPKTRRFVGSWIGSMMNHHWVYDGELDTEGRILTLYSEGPSFTGADGLQSYKDVFEVESPDLRVLRAYVKGEDGAWSHFMTTTYKRIG